MVVKHLKQGRRDEGRNQRERRDLAELPLRRPEVAAKALEPTGHNVGEDSIDPQEESNRQLHQIFEIVRDRRDSPFLRPKGIPSRRNDLT